MCVGKVVTGAPTLEKAVAREALSGHRSSRSDGSSPDGWTTYGIVKRDAKPRDFCVVVTATFRLRYVLVITEHATRRMLHANVTAHPTVPWTIQQLREAMPSDHGYRFLIHDRDSVFSQRLNQQVQYQGLWGLKPPVRSPQANALCERLLGTLRRECLDFLIPLTEHHLRRALQQGMQDYHAGRFYTS